ncbi:EscU/YscU/HrcU family type III secretion system export apparatus switch protein [Paludibacterium sp. B53371]|uniref:EscU/YscU/HrcU family type III secretion system export apparatus switch protein n=1 Tax=Paludibacterium sp. B53371 TaxID=2806263 RepID=UPI001C04A2E0|nr:EscU/YscU/HrcU family type III secretion system export apparatus switch protein [Paludibacterium sp. B53371]
MSEEKKEKPTAKRLRDARKEGQIARSQDVGLVIQSGVVLLWLMLEGKALYDALAEDLWLVIAVGQQDLGGALARYLPHLGWLWLRFCGGLALVLVLCLISGGLLQTGFLFAPKALKLSGQRINPLSNAKNLLSMKNLIELFKSLCKVLILGLTFAYLIRQYGPSLAYLPGASVQAGLLVGARLLLWMWGIQLATGMVFAIADYGYQRFMWLKQLRMSHKDLQQEYKHTEGDPEIRQRRKDLHQELLSGSLAGKVAAASVVVRNPTRLAVCLRFVPGDTPLPQITAMGRDHRARHILRLAERHGIPVVERVPLARALFADCKPGDYIPESLFAAVAEVLRWLMQTTGDPPALPLVTDQPQSMRPGT